MCVCVCVCLCVGVHVRARMRACACVCCVLCCSSAFELPCKTSMCGMNQIVLNLHGRTGLAVGIQDSTHNGAKEA